MSSRNVSNFRANFLDIHWFRDNENSRQMNSFSHIYEPRSPYFFCPSHHTRSILETRAISQNFDSIKTKKFNRLCSFQKGPEFIQMFSWTAVKMFFSKFTRIDFRFYIICTIIYLWYITNSRRNQPTLVIKYCSFPFLRNFFPKMLTYLLH